MSFRGFQWRDESNDDFGPPPPPFRIRRRRVDFKGFGGINPLVLVGVALIFLFIAANVGKTIYVDRLWFEGVGYRSVYSKEIETRVMLFFGGALLFAVFFGLNVWYAARTSLRMPARGLEASEAAALRSLLLLVLIAATLFFAVIFGTIAASEWDKVLAYMNAEPFGIKDPQFQRDIGFYVFKLPALNFIRGWLMGATILTTLMTAGVYLYRYVTLGVEKEHVAPTRVHLCLLLVLVVAVFGAHYWLDRFDLLYSTSGVTFGASYADVHARLPLLYVGMALAGITAVALLYTALRGGFVLPAGAMVVWVVVIGVGGVVYPSTVQRVNVQPNELEKERQYIERNIAATREAFNLDEIEERPFPASPQVTQQEIASSPDTISNMRLLDVRPLRDTYAQIQALRRLYDFRNIDIDRYVIDGRVRQVMLSARELSADRLPPEAQSWVNKRLQFTHGYGAVMSPVNEVVEEGLPELFLRDIPVQGKVPVTRPEIYYGEEPDHYVIVKTKAQEFDYPVGDGNMQTVFQGEGGVQLGSFFRRLMLAWEFQDANILISGSVDSNSRLLYRRNIKDRVERLAPFLRLDSDPYLVIAEGKFYWIQDAYTTTDHYPYSQPANEGYNYIRNSVKVVIDAYDGATTFYITDDTDPIIKTYARIFPKLFTSQSEMPEFLRSHLRYPEDLFLSQVNQYRTYHIQDAGVLYNKEDIWNIPSEAYTGTEVSVAPYYVIMRIPGEPREEFALILPLTPSGNRQNTIAWVAARSDAPNYGKLLSFRFPTDSLVFGPRQVESRIDQDPLISSQFALWNQSGSRVIRGNLLMIPIGNGNLFVEPIYLQAETSRLPELKRVVVANGNSIAMEPTFERALAVLFGQAAPTPPGADPGTSPPAQPTPGVSPTPSPGSTPRPTATPPATPVPGSISELARRADEVFLRAQTALRNGDFATYGQEIAVVQQLIQQIVQQSGGP